jgi:uncharacterized Zn finger protein (UPF0148 family)
MSDLLLRVTRLSTRDDSTQPWVLVKIDHRVLCPVCEEALVFEARDRISDEELHRLLDEHVRIEHELK